MSGAGDEELSMNKSKSTYRLPQNSTMY